MQNYNWNYPTTMWVGENRIKDLGSACKKLNINKTLPKKKYPIRSNS